ncbi:high choriolytic enzyme 1-like [Hippocampus zosterae]|uniref:high choriolytic enzyme 1-like n=1 Tax=Hippocampus zosterae TaxID=109293 RepID=UPI00223D45E9|nr:high choriolytic enzyme 1-like [Hippocampus zosterae]
MLVRVAALSFLLFSVQSFTIKDSLKMFNRHSGDTPGDDDSSVSTLIERANVNVGKNQNEPLVIFGDIAIPTGLQNADACTRDRCLWPKAADGFVYVPYRISGVYSGRERRTIVNGLRSFAASTCVRFTPLNGQRDFVDIQSLSGCYSFVGRRGRGQVVSLSRQGCVFRQVIQHELLHALGFNHEQTRSDRDRHVRILLENVISGMESNFRRLNTRNLGTPYDYTSVMHYGRFAFSKNGQPTIIPIPNRDAVIGQANRMSPIDIRRVNLLYDCRMYL